MLPDFPQVKERAVSLINHAVRQFVDSHPPTAGVPKERHFEGRGWAREGDPRDVGRDYQELKMPYEIAVSDLIAKGPEAIVEKIPQIAGGMAAQLQELMQRRMKEAEAEGSPHVASFEGVPETCDDVLRLYERMEIPFDREGKPVMPSILVTNRAMFDRFKEFEGDPECRRKLNELLERKKREHDIREGTRALVD